MQADTLTTTREPAGGREPAHAASTALVPPEGNSHGSLRTKTASRRAMTSAEWIDHFRINLTRLRVDWHLEPQLELPRDRRLVRSLQAWQLGETSDGCQLLQAATRYAEQQDDLDYVEAIRLFIREEQKHGENLGRYLDRLGAERIDRDLGDWLFRKVRHFLTNMEVWTVTVVIVETFAQIYYKALSRASACPLLQSVCTDILIDEAHHIRFQTERLRSIRSGFGSIRKRLSLGAYRVHFHAITLAVWIGHHHVFQRSGMTFRSYLRQASRRFRSIERNL